MNTAVVDATVIVAALLDSGPDGRWAEDKVADFTLSAPHHVLVETSNVIRRATSAGDVGVAEGSQAHADLVLLDVELYPFAPFADRIWELRGSVTAYDAWYVALAERLGCPLLTLDRRLSRATGAGCRFLLP